MELLALEVITIGDGMGMDVWLPEFSISLLTGVVMLWVTAVPVALTAEVVLVGCMLLEVETHSTCVFTLSLS